MHAVTMSETGSLCHIQTGVMYANAIFMLNPNFKAFDDLFISILFQYFSEYFILSIHQIVTFILQRDS